VIQTAQRRFTISYLRHQHIFIPPDLCIGMEKITPCSKPEYNTQEAVAYLKEAGGDDVDVRHSIVSDDEIAFRWDGMNRSEIFTHLLEHGWAITSMDKNGTMWLERLSAQ
jgi:hypothetical protein